MRNQPPKKPFVPRPPHALNMREVYLQTIEELARPYPSIPLASWPTWTRMTGGFRMKEYTIFCGPTGAGKTTFLANLSAQLVRQRVKHFVMSVETGHTDFMKRILSALSGRDVNTGDAVHPDQLSSIHAENAQYLEDDTIEFSLYEDRLPVEQLMHDIEHMVRERGCKVAIIDNLNFFMEVKNSGDQVVEMDRVTHALIIFCKRIDVHLIMVMHPKKTDGGRVESEFDIKGSSTAVQEAHNVLLFNRPKQEDVQSGDRDMYDREVTIKKMRRRGKHVGRTLIFETRADGAQYIEKGWV
jgi:replicative DNA helicase